MGLLDDFRGKEEINQLKKRLTEKDVEVATLQTNLDKQRIASQLESTRLRKSAEESANTNGTLTRELGQATVAIDRLTKNFEALERSAAEDRSQAAITIADLKKKLAAVAREVVAAIKAERDRTAQEIQGLRAGKDLGYQEREAKLAKKSEELLHDRQKFQQQAMDLQRREQRWEQVVKPQLARYEAHCSLDDRERKLNALQLRLDEHERNLKDREADLIRRQCTDETLAKREAEIADWDKLLADTADELKVKTAVQDQRESELDDRTKKLDESERELAAFRERAKHLDEEAAKISCDAKKLESKESEQQERHAERLSELRQQRSELRRIAKELTQREDAITKREYDANETLRQAVQANAEATQKLKQAEALNVNRHATEEKLRASTLANTALQNRFDKLNFEVSGLRNKLTITAAAPAEVIVHEMSVFQNEAVLRWMFKETEPRQLAVTSGYLCTTGTGPWPDDDFKRQLEENNFSCWEMPDAEVEHIIVGRDDWDGDLLLEQIDARQGESLRVYSQEMWFAMMATGRDPFDEDDSELLKAFGEGHPALEFLMDLEFPWPLFAVGEDKKRPEIEISDYDPRKHAGVIIQPPVALRSNTPLTALKYHVGLNGIEDEGERRELLRSIITCSFKQLPMVGSVDYMGQWGEARTPQRVRCIAYHLSWNIGFQGAKEINELARQHWLDDLKWLTRHYRAKVPASRWPKVPVS